MIPPQIPAAERERRRETIRKLNLAYWLAAREAARSDPLYATSAYGIDGETADHLADMAVEDLAEMASHTVTTFRPIGPTIPGADAREAHRLHVALISVAQLK